MVEGRIEIFVVRDYDDELEVVRHGGKGIQVLPGMAAWYIDGFLHKLFWLNEEAQCGSTEPVIREVPEGESWVLLRIDYEAQTVRVLVTPDRKPEDCLLALVYRNGVVGRIVDVRHFRSFTVNSWCGIMG
jgi:hypothetical protein